MSYAGEGRGVEESQSGWLVGSSLTHVMMQICRCADVQMCRSAEVQTDKLYVLFGFVIYNVAQDLLMNTKYSIADEPHVYVYLRRM